MDEILKDIIDRDERDMNRAVSPLKQAEDAVLVDSSEMGIDEVVESILSVYRKKGEWMNVKVAETAGFCFGVQRAVDRVYELIGSDASTDLHTGPDHP